MIEALNEITTPVAISSVAVTIALLTFFYKLLSDHRNDKRERERQTEERLSHLESKQVDLDNQLDRIDLRLENIKTEYEKNRLLSQDNFKKLESKLDNISNEILNIIKNK